ncbi:hypothetical protein B4U79_18016 [Dinothrombium tinctorium]|uniref:Uncharacterized protein n=1 Tax=Dinothrombium tinctorium TaxID=1965070 RepID=A0A443RAB5_9ACAR|nr:hypothetical protein B4U79_18016 [Dinothrombium tinctorium]
MVANKPTIFNVIRNKDKTFIEKEIASKKYDLNVVDDYGYSPIFSAVHDENVFLTKLLIENGAAFKDKTRSKDIFCDPLHIAARRAFLSIVKLLVEREANVSAIDAVSKTPIWYAFLQYRHSLPILNPIVNKICLFLIDHGASFLESEAK